MLISVLFSVQIFLPHRQKPANPLPLTGNEAVTPLTHPPSKFAAGLGLWLACLPAGPSHAQSETLAAPLSVIEWLGSQPAPLEGRVRPVAMTRPSEPATTNNALPPGITVSPLTEGAPRQIGLVPASVTGLPADLWRGSEASRVISMIAALPDLHLPAAQSLLYTVLLAEAHAPQQGGEDALALARVRKLMTLGALDPALSLIEQAGIANSSGQFDLWMDLSLLTGTEDRACAMLDKNAHLTRNYAFRIFCAARAGHWDNAALTFGSAQALDLLPPDTLDLLDRFLFPDAYEDSPRPRPPRKLDPLSFRLFEAIGEPLPTRNLPRAFAVADLRELSGWKSQLEAAERLTRAGALPDNQLLGLYSARKAAASGGIWDRVAALQRFETALSTHSVEAVAKTLPLAWAAMHEAELEVAFAGLFAEQLVGYTLTGQAATVASDMILLSSAYEKAASNPNTQAPALHLAIAGGETPAHRPDDPVAAAVYDAFSDAPARPELLVHAREGRLGESILSILDLLHDATEGDAPALRDALSTLRALGLEDTARRAALQTLILIR